MKAGDRTRTTRAAVPMALFIVLASYAGLIPGAAAGSKEPDILLVFTGDINPARGVEEMCDLYDDPYLPYYGLSNYTSKGDITCGNLETSVSERGEPCGFKRFNFRTEPGKLAYIREAGFDVLSLANNHILDYGPDAALDTQANVEKYGMEPFGLWYLNDAAAGGRIQRPALIERKGVTFAFLGYTEFFHKDYLATETTIGPCPMDLELMKTDIEYANTVADVVVVSLHWFYDEYDKTANEDEIETCRKLCDYGAHILADHGHHVLQEVECYNGSLILHCLGNTVFDQSIKSTHKSMIAMVHMKGVELDSLELVPLRKNERHQYIPQGTILKEPIRDEMLLNWSDFNDRMFESKQFLTEYEGAPELWYAPFVTIPAVQLVPVALLSVLLLLSLLLLYRKVWRRTCNKS